MRFMGAELRKITLRDGLVSAALALAFSGGWAMALLSYGRDPWQAANLFIPLFLGSLVSFAGINPMRSPQLLVLVAIGAGGLMTLVEWATPALMASA